MPIFITPVSETLETGQKFFDKNWTFDHGLTNTPLPVVFR